MDAIREDFPVQEVDNPRRVHPVDRTEQHRYDGEEDEEHDKQGFSGLIGGGGVWVRVWMEVFGSLK